MRGGTVAVKRNDAKLLSKEPVGSQRSELTVRVQPRVLLKQTNRLLGLGPVPAVNRPGLVAPGGQGFLDFF